MRNRSGKAVLWVVIALVVLLGGGFALLRSGILDDKGTSAGTSKRPEAPPTNVEADPAPSFEPGALRALVEKNLPNGIDSTVTAYIRWLAADAKRIRDFKDYSMTLVKTERINGKMWPTEKAFVKVRNQPFSVYMTFSEPKGLKGQEVIFVEGKNDGRIVGHTGGILSLVGTLRVLPDSPRAMQGNRHPIMDLGISHMVEEAVRNVPGDLKRGKSEFEFKLGEKKLGKTCTLFIIKRKEVDPEGKDPKFHSDYMYFDDENNLPIFYQLYEWPEKKGEKPVLVEEYTHQDLKIDNGFTDLDFDEKNPAYHY